MTGYAERRVLSLLLAYPALTVDLKADDFEYAFHRLLFAAVGDEIATMPVLDEVKVYALNLDENWAPENLGAFADIVKKAAAQRRFAQGVERLRK